MKLFPLSFGNLWSCWQLELHKGKETNGAFPSKLWESMAGLGGRNSGFTKLHITNITHHFWQIKKVYKYKKDQNCPCAYLMTDSVATIALGVISKNLGDINDVKDKSLFEIIAFWHHGFCCIWVALIPLQLIAWKIISFG